ncbi:MAG TPA: hypothetical protein VH143_00210 [Kofleriaceae bacterium]|jgi:hypothetical protein|nr:hypothetical protein [Kofleriaceae bacterium]
MRSVAVAVAIAACGRSSGVPDRDLGGLVVAPAKPGKVDVDRAIKDPDALGAALALPEHAIDAALGPHVTTIAMATHVTENAKPVTDLDDTTTIELGDAGAYHAVYSNSADYGREVIFEPGAGSAAAQLYLRPRYQRWHQRAPETPEEAQQILDSFAEPVAATWDLVAPAVELSDRGTVTVAGRSGRKIDVKPAGSPKHPAAEPLPQRKWRETRTIDGLTGEIVLDAETGAPLSVKLSGTVSFLRDGRRFAMQVSVQSDITNIGKAAAISVPAGDDVVATPERLREVDDRDFLLQGIAPPLHKKPETK